MITPLNIGIIGCGQITTYHRDGYRRFGLPVVAGTDVAEAVREKFRTEEPQARMHERLEDLLANPEVQVLDVAAPHRRDIREPLLEKIVRAGKPVLLQKPFAHYYEDALRYHRMFEEAGVPLMINQNSVFSGGVLETTNRVLREKEIGEIFCGRVRNAWDYNPGNHPWYGKGERWWLTDMAVHELAIAHHFLGAPVSVSAASGRDPAQDGVEGDGFFHLILSYSNRGSLLVNECGTYYGPDKHAFSIELQGDKGILSLEAGKRAMLSHRVVGQNPIREEILTPYRWFPEGFGLVMHHFQHALQTGARPLCSSYDNLYLMATIEAAYRSAKTGMTVKPEEVMGDRYDSAHGVGGLQGPPDWSAPIPLEDVPLVHNYGWSTYTPEETK